MDQNNKTNGALKILEDCKLVVWKEIEKNLKDPVFPKQFQIPKRFQYLHDYHWKIVSDYPKRKGKYIRPTILILVAKAMGAEEITLIKTASAMQLSEDWILNHDDIQDNSPLRRGKPSLHKIYGVELALNAGDTLHAIMWKVLTENIGIIGKEKTFRIMNEFYKIIMRTTLGQTVDVKWFLENKPEINDNEWYFIADSKSSYYSISAPTRLGAILADANEDQLNYLSEFGVNLGRSFQLVDDILDVTSDFRGLKQKGNDIYEGKRTLILGHLLRTADKHDKSKILSILGKKRKKKTISDITWIIDKMHDYGSIKYAQGLALKFKQKAEDIFDRDLLFLEKEPFRGQLRTIMDFIVERDH